MSLLFLTAMLLSEGRAEAASPRLSWWRHFLKALEESRRKQAEREIGRFIRNRGGVLNDQMERRIAARLIGGADDTD